MSGFNIPADMVQHDKHLGSVVSIRDFMIALGASDQQLRDSDERCEILEREPWRKDGQHFEVMKEYPDGSKLGFNRGEIDWSGTRFDLTPKAEVGNNLSGESTS